MGNRRVLVPLGPRRITRSHSRVDHISTLPDDMLDQILSRLRCVRTAARTGLLSRRWRGLWTNLDEVSFCGLTLDMIHTALNELKRSSLVAFDMHVNRGNGRRRLDAANVTSLLCAAASKSPKKLTVTIPVYLYDTYTPVDLPSFPMATSIKLDGQEIFFALSPTTEFPLLETLTLSGCIIDLATLVPRCPVLRVLSITKNPSEVEEVMVHSATLQELVVSTFRSSIDIVAPALKKLTLALDKGSDYSLSVVAPMVEEVSWRCLYYSIYVGIGQTMWRVCSLKIQATKKMAPGRLTDSQGDGSRRCCAHVLSLDILPYNGPLALQRNFTQELERIPITHFSVLALKIGSSNRDLGPLVSYLLGICTGVQRLELDLLECLVVQGYPRLKTTLKKTDQGSYEKRTNQTVTFLTDLIEVQIKGFRGDDDEVDFLKLLFRCAPMLQTMTLKLSHGVCDDWYNIFLDTVQEYPSVNSNVCIG